MADTQSINLFVYGTLTKLEVLRALTGKQFQCKPAVLMGYRMIDPPYSFPLLLPDPRHRVEGLVILNVDEDSLHRIDDYEDEGELYHRQLVKVWVGDEMVEAYVYFGDPNRLLKSADLKKLLS